MYAPSGPSPYVELPPPPGGEADGGRPLAGRAGRGGAGAPGRRASSTLTALQRAKLVIGWVLVTDQVTKGLAHYVARSDNGGWLDPVLNPDLLLSLYSGAPALLVALAFTALLGFSLHLLRLTRSGSLSGWVAGLLVGGAVSNLLDRFAGGMVRDWLSLPWAVANLADLAVAAGALGYLAAITRWVVAESEAPSTGAPLAG